LRGRRIIDCTPVVVAVAVAVAVAVVFVVVVAAAVMLMVVVNLLQARRLSQWQLRSVHPEFVRVDG
jgi:hypothetical protein